MTKDFIDWVDVKGEIWYKAEDVLICLGYTENRIGSGELIVLKNKNCTPSSVTPSRLMDNYTWWNSTSLVRFKSILTKSKFNKSKYYLNNWNSMSRIMKASVSDVVLKSTPNSVEKPSTTYRSLAENTKTFKEFGKEFKRVEGKPMGAVSSWKVFAEKHPIIWEDIRDIVEPRIKAFDHSEAKSTKKTSSTIKQALDEVKEKITEEKEKFFTLTFHKPDKFLWIFPAKGCEFSHVTKEKDLPEVVARALKQGYTLIKIEEYVEPEDI